MVSSCLVKIHRELVIFICHVHVHFALENVRGHADIHVGKPRVDSVEDCLSVRQCFDVFFFCFGGFVTDKKFLHYVDFSVALLVVDWVAHEVLLTFDALFNINSNQHVTKCCVTKVFCSFNFVTS